jgi:RNA polymerase sigma-70 factor (ECF subfamily)
MSSKIDVRPAVKAGADFASPESAAHFSEQGLRLAAWMKAAQAGDRRAYDNVVRASIPFIKMVARRQGVSADLVNDVVQETLLAVHRTRHSYDPVRPFAAWLRTIAQRRAIDVMRSQGRISAREIYEPISFENHSDPTGNPESQAEQIDRKSLLGIAIASLPARQREAVEQLVIKGRSLVDAGVAIGMTPGALKVNFHRALKTLRAQMGAEKPISGRDSSKLPARIMTNGTDVSKKLEHTLVKFAV